MIKIFSADFDSLPELLTSEDLVKMGMYSSVDAAYVARAKGHSPDWIQMDRRVLYPKEWVRSFLEKYVQKGTITLKDY